MDYTANYHLHKPAAADFYDVADQNANMDIIDAGLAQCAPAEHEHTAEDVTSGVLPAARGGTGQASLSAARNAMGLGNTTGALPVANGGTGASDAAGARANLGITPGGIGAAAASHQHGAGDIASGTLPVERGGTGASDAAGALTNLEARPLVEKLIPLGTDILSLAPGVYYVDGVNADEMTAAMNLPANMWHWHILAYSDRNTTSQEYNYKLILAFPSGSKRFYVNMMSYDGAWTGWSNIYTSGDKPTLGELGISVQSAAPSSPKDGDLWVW